MIDKTKTKTLRLDHVEFDIYEFLEFHNENGTLVAYPPKTDFANLRCSVTSLYRKGEEILEVSEREIPRLANKAGVEFESIDGKFFFHVKKPSSSDPLDTVHFWYLGLGGHIATISVFIDHHFQNDAYSKLMQDCASLIVKTFRRAK